MKIKNITQTAIMAAIICVAAPFSVSVGPIPISLATFAVYIAGAVLGWKKGSLAVIIYILLGCIGLPVFSNFEGGFQKIAGVTGGYIIGYIPCAFIIGLITYRWNKILSYPVSMVLGTAACYIVGTAWFMFQTNTSLAAALLVCVVPFLIGDAIKIAAASIISIQIRKRITI